MTSSLPLTPVLLIRALCQDSLVIVWVSQETGECIWTTLQGWN